MRHGAVHRTMRQRMQVPVLVPVLALVAAGVVVVAVVVVGMAVVVKTGVVGGVALATTACHRATASRRRTLRRYGCLQSLLPAAPAPTAKSRGFAAWFTV